MSSRDRIVSFMIVSCQARSRPGLNLVEAPISSSTGNFGVTVSGPAALLFHAPASRWSEAEAATKTPAELLLYRSNLLGSDLTVTNFGVGLPTCRFITGIGRLDGRKLLEGRPKTEPALLGL